MKQVQQGALGLVREQMRAHGLDFYLVPSTDDHQDEYVPDCWQRRRFISGFSGSAGDALVGLEGAWLWADSRYWLQAEAELDPALFSLQRLGAPDVLDLEDWLVAHAAGCAVGVDPHVVSLARARKLTGLMEGQGGELRCVEPNLVDAVWADAPPVPDAPAATLDVRFHGRLATEKLSRVRTALAARDCDAHVITALDAVAWLFNLRGADVGYNPVLISYGLVEGTRTRLFTSVGKVGEDLLGALLEAGVHVEPYDAIGPALRELTGRVWIDPASSRFIADAVAASAAETYEAESPVTGLKAVKNEIEQAGMRRAHLRDGVAVVRFLHWLDGAWKDGSLDEQTAADRLDAFRAEGEHARDLSFPTISGFGPNGAIVHYRVQAASARAIDDSAPYLVDSGAQYLDGTTDVTRTVHLGSPSDAERTDYTRVLRAHLALRQTRFPKGTTGAQLDAIARRPLWEAGLDYGHGTGHGVGCYLNVHERPPTISPRATVGAVEPGMVVSNEPGLYRAGQYGIRIENLVLVVDASGSEAAEVPFRAFEDLTLVPYCRKLIDRDALTRAEIAAVDGYHARVREALASRLDADARAWLERETAAL